MTGSRIRSTFDFGLVSLDITGLRADDSGIYVCKAVNKLGEAVSTCTIRVEAHSWLLGQALRPEALAKIAALEEQKCVTCRTKRRTTSRPSLSSI